MQQIVPIAPWTRAIRSSSDVTGVPCTILFILPHRNSRELSNLVTTELVPLHQSIDLGMQRWGESAHFYQSPQMAKGLHTCCIRTPKRIATNCDTRSFSNFDAMQHPNRAFPDMGSSLNNDQFAVLHNILSVVCFFFFFGTLCILTQTSIFAMLCILWNSLSGPH